MLSSWILPELQFLQVGKVLPLRPYQCRAEQNNYILCFISPLPIAHNSTGLVCSSTTSLVHVQLGIVMTPGLFYRTAAWPVVSHLYSSAADYVELYVQFCICSNLTAGKLVFSRLLCYFIKAIFHCLPSNTLLLLYEFIKRTF